MIQIKSLFVFQSDVSNRSLLALRPIELLNRSRYSNRFRTVRTVRPVRTVRTVRTVQTVRTIWTSSNSSNYSDKFEHVRTLRVRFDQVRSHPCTSLVVRHPICAKRNCSFKVQIQKCGLFLAPDTFEHSNVQTLHNK